MASGGWSTCSCDQDISRMDWYPFGAPTASGGSHKQDRKDEGKMSVIGSLTSGGVGVLLLLADPRRQHFRQRPRQSHSEPIVRDE